MTDQDVSRRRFLQGTAATLLGVGLAGCSTGEKIDDDPNPYDYTFVEGDELARDLLAYEEDDVTTQTTVEWTGTYIRENTENRFRRYVAHPDDTDYTFDVVESVNGPVHETLGETLDDDSHEDIPLQLYGFVDILSGDELDTDLEADEQEYHNAVFVVEDAEHVNTDDGSTEVSGNESG